MPLRLAAVGVGACIAGGVGIAGADGGACGPLAWTATSCARYEEYQPPGASGSEASWEPTTRSGSPRALARRGDGGRALLSACRGGDRRGAIASGPAVIGPGASCRTLDALTKPGCVAQRADLSPAQQGVFAATTGLALLVPLAVVILVVVRTADAPDVRTTSARWTRPATSWVFAAASLLYAGQFTVFQTTLPALTEEGSADFLAATRHPRRRSPSWSGSPSRAWLGAHESASCRRCLGLRSGSLAGHPAVARSRIGPRRPAAWALCYCFVAERQKSTGRCAEPRPGCCSGSH